MKFRYKVVIAIIVIVSVGVLSYCFLNVFAFESEEDRIPLVSEVDDELIEELYGYLPVTGDYNASTIYTANYQTDANTNYNALGQMVLNYIDKNDSLIKEVLTNEELSNAGITGSPLYKISKDNFIKNTKLILGSDSTFAPNSLELSFIKRAKLVNDYYYFYEIENNSINNYIYYTSIYSYTLEENNEVIKIYSYYLKCNKDTKICYNNELEGNNAIVNKKITYIDDLNIFDYKNDLEVYEHTFKYESDHYYWQNTTEADI